MFSIIIPLYNKAPYIAKAIQSVADQTYQEFELIIIDDGSTDESLAKLRVLSSEYRDKSSEFFAKLRIVEQKNQGVSSTRNNGVKLAKYDYIAFLDADDWWEPTFLEEMKVMIEEFPDAGIYGSSYCIVKNGNSRLACIGVEKGFTKGYIDYFKTYSNSMSMPLTSITVAIPKSTFMSHYGFKTSLKLGEDFDLWVRIALNHKVALLNKPLANYNQDVDINNRGVVHNKIYDPTTHFIFNMDYMEEHENRNPAIKQTMDLQRIYTLMRYKRTNAFPSEFKKEINKVNFKKQPLTVRMYYFFPSFAINFYQTVIEVLVTIKGKLK